MFTGLIEDIGTVKSIITEKGLKRITITTSLPPKEIRLGDSLSINGVCLTVVGVKDSSFTVEATTSTLKRTNLGELRSDDRVNLERALAKVERWGGHLVQGHVDGVGIIKEVRRLASSIILNISTPEEISRYLIPGGAIAVEGVSLTIAQCQPRSFLVSIIPYTSTHTILSMRRREDKVNIEVDILARYVEKILGKGARPSGITEQFLASYDYT